ncbi:hypothetical protein FNW52_10295 [Flavobacterium sp. ZT3R18]|uniref:hypothetical protein n=1 Tax=Flavobacterium sp. ZT3R18 TaxID=2594429 RepID=UPI00117999EF|nr:hypothetical protein [Flavobacterium sp. ZT3R18]TRX35869.1 hypothetical protein FNW52_10295 [Flavobacterium sp. ZT3R18]
MRKSIILAFVCVLLQSCNSQTKNKIEEKTNKMESKSTMVQPFDLASLTLNEDINDILSSVKLSKTDTIKINNLTLMGNEKLVFDSEKLLTFNKIKLANKNSKGTNNVIFYYGKIDDEIGQLNNEKNNIVGMYQVNLYAAKESEELFNSLKLKFNKPSDIFNLGPINTYLWIRNNIYYYYFTKDNDEFYRVLFVFKKGDKEWIDFIGSLGFDSGRIKLVK